MNQDSNISVLMNRFDYGQEAYFAFVLPCRFCCRDAIFEKNGDAKTVNQAFPEIFSNYASLYADRDCQIKLPFKIFRNTLVFLGAANLEVVREEVERIHSVLFYLPPDEEIFNLAKANAISSMKKRYEKIYYRALYKILEFSESEKQFHFSKLVKDMAELDFAVFCRYLACFVQPQNCVFYRRLF